ncbi:MAG: putative small protein [Bradyrhizobium sp.]|jgi:uncharacterized protein YodC (DUF2158 family)|nr:putative small protein [Bradyrhizobium sp.]
MISKFEFKAGDKVRLKKGGPVMTVTNDQDEIMVWCEWVDENQKPQGMGVDASKLERAN